jgi:two-component sensor histidine kinase
MIKLPNKFSSLVGLLLIMRSGTGISQAPTTLPLQPEKLKYAQEVESEALAKKDTLLMAEAYYLYGKVYGAANNYLKAKNYFLQSLRILEKRGDSYHLGRLYCRMSILETDQSNTAQALKYARSALPIFQRISSQKGLMEAHNHIGQIYMIICSGNLNNSHRNPVCDSALYYHNKGLQIAYQLRDTNAIIGSNNTLGELYRLQRSPKLIGHYQIILKHYRKSGKKHQEAITLLELAKGYLNFGQLDQAYILAKEAEKIYNQLRIREAKTEMGFIDFYDKYYRGRKDWEKAYKHIRILADMERNQLLADRDGAVSRLAVEYDTEKKEVQLKNQQNELKFSKQIQQNQRRFLAALSILFLGAIAATTIFYRLFRKNLRLSQQNATLVREQNHRVKNNLQLVSSLLSLQANRLTDEAAKTAVEDSQLRIEVMAILHRKLYDGDHLAMVNMSEFIKELVEIALQSFGHEQTKVNYDIVFSLQIATDPALRIGLIINELVANACKYAFPKNPNPILGVECSLKNQLLTLKVTDNGPGFQVVENQKKQTFGMRLIQIQVQQLKGTCRFRSEQGSVFEMECKV